MVMNGTLAAIAPALEVHESVTRMLDSLPSSATLSSAASMTDACATRVTR